MKAVNGHFLVTPWNFHGRFKPDPAYNPQHIYIYKIITDIFTRSIEFVISGCCFGANILVFLPFPGFIQHFQQLFGYWNSYFFAGLGGKMVKPYPQDSDGEIIEIPFLGGLMHEYLRSCKAA